MVSILITSSSHKVWLVEECLRAGFDKIMVYDHDPNCVTYKIATRAFYSELYAVEHTLNYSQLPEMICQEHEIDYLLPTRGGELQWFQDHAEEFEPTQVLVGSKSLLHICMDKWLLYQFCVANKIKTPETRQPNPQIGYSHPKNWIYKENLWQERLHGVEYSVDGFFDYVTAESLGIVCRERVKIRYGEAWQTIIVDNPDLCKKARRIARELKLEGVWNMQFIKESSLAEENYYLIDVNPRVGGASRCSIRNGLEWLKYLVTKDKGVFQKPRIGAGMYRYAEDVFV